MDPKRKSQELKSNAFYICLKKGNAEIRNKGLNIKLMTMKGLSIKLISNSHLHEKIYSVVLLPIKNVEI